MRFGLVSKVTDSAVDAGSGGVKLSAEPLMTGELLPFVCRAGEDCVGEGGGPCANRAPSGESGVLHLSFGIPLDRVRIGVSMKLPLEDESFSAPSSLITFGSIVFFMKRDFPMSVVLENSQNVSLCLNNIKHIT